MLRFLLKRLQVKKFDENKLYCSEILSMLVNGDTDVQRRLGTLQGKSDHSCFCFDDAVAAAWVLAL